MRSFVISLERAAERRERFFRHAQANQWEVEYFPAVDKYDLIIRNSDPTLAQVTHVSDPGIQLELVAGSWGSITLSAGQIACALSHMVLWRKLLESGEDAWCIFEDDAEIEHPLTPFEMPPDTDFVYISDRVTAVLTEDVDHDDEEWRRKNPLAILLPGCGTEAYIVTKRGAEAGLKIMTPMFWPIDLQLMAQAQLFVGGYHSLRKEMRKDLPFCNMYCTTQTYTKHEDEGFSYLG